MPMLLPTRDHEHTDDELAEGVVAPPRPVARYRTPPPGLRSFTRSARHGALGPSTVRV